ncbi:MAG: M20/M25/M40 family metallo-hydrolase [Thermoanaerobaculia bacterium]
MGLIEKRRFSREFYLTLAIVLAAAAAGAVAIWRTAQIPDSLLYIPEEAEITPEVEMLRAYIRIDTTNPPGNEIAGARFLAQRLRRGGVEPEIIETAPGRAAVYARIRGTRPGEGLLLLNHIDVVPANAEAWTYPPFEARLERNMIWGRGALDMKSIAICQLAAFLALARSAAPPERDVAFLAVPDEERGGAMGMGWILEHRPDVLEGIRYAANEGGVTETVKGEIVYFGVEVGSMQPVKLAVRAARRETLEELRIALEPLFEPDAPEEILPQVREYFTTVAPHRLRYAPLLEDIDRTIAEGRFWLLHPSYRQMTAEWLIASGIRTEDDGRHAMTVTIVTLPGRDPDKAVARFRERVAAYPVEIELTYRPVVAPLSSTGTPFFGAIEHAVRRHYGDVPVGPLVMVDVATDSRFLRSRGIDAYGFWPYPVDFFQTQGIHGADERIRVDWFQEGVELTTELVADWALGK